MTMPLTTKNRTALFEALAPLAGEEATEAMLAEFPATENDELVTKQFLRAELADLRAELTGEFHGRLRSQTQWIVATMIGLFGTMIATGGLLVAFGS